MFIVKISKVGVQHKNLTWNNLICALPKRVSQLLSTKQIYKAELKCSQINDTVNIRYSKQIQLEIPLSRIHGQIPF